MPAHAYKLKNFVSQMSSLGYVLTVCVFRFIKDRTPFLELHCGFILTTAKARNNK